MTDITISLLDNNTLVLGVPSPEAIHHLEIPLTVDGLRLIRKTLAARKKRDRDEGLISRNGNPTQAQVNAWLREERRRSEEERKRAEADKLAKIVAADPLAGVDLGDLEL